MPDEPSAGLRRWDREIVDEYMQRLAGEPRPLSSCAITLQSRCLRDLVLVLADVAVRSADRLGPGLATLDNAVLRDAALSVAVARYVAILPSPDRARGDNALAERILAGLVLRLDAAQGERAPSLVQLSFTLPADRYEQVNAEVRRVLAATDLSDLGDYRDDVEADLLSSLVEAVALEWMHQRSARPRHPPQVVGSRRGI